MKPETQLGLKNLVFVDDDNIANKLVERFLKNSPCAVHTFANTDQARKFISNNAVHALVVDLRMPLISGIDFLDGLKLHSRPSKITHIIVQTGAEPDPAVRTTVESLGYRLLLKEEILGNQSTLKSLMQ